MMTEKPLSVQSLASRYWQWPVKVKNLLSKVLKCDWPTTKHSPTHRQHTHNGKIRATQYLIFRWNVSGRSLSPGQPSLVHSQEPWRHTLRERDHLETYFKVFLWLYLGTHRGFSPGVAVLRDSGSWREVSSHVHTGTLRYLHTAITVQNLTHWNTKTRHVTATSDRKTQREEAWWVSGYQGMYSRPHTPPCRPPGCWDYGSL